MKAEYLLVFYMKFILGRKLGMTQIFRPDGTAVPVTRVEAGPCVVTQVKTKAHDGANAVQVGFGAQKVFRLTQAEQGHVKDIRVGADAGTTVRWIRDMNVHDETHELKKGDVFKATIFTPGEKVQVVGVSKGKGFQGVVRRHGFSGGPASHGHKDNLRMPGSIGSTGPQRVFKGTRMPGHMGDQQVTVKNLEIVEVNSDTNEVLIKGAVPGARNGLLVISSQEGKIEIEAPAVVEETKVEVTPEAPVTEPPAEEATTV